MSTVTIDPEDRGQVERLFRLVEHHYAAEFGDSYDIDVYQRALRAFAVKPPKPPKPEEPQGLGAVVEDDEGVRFVRTGVEGWSWHEAGGGPTSWQRIDAVRVLSEGVVE